MKVNAERIAKLRKRNAWTQEELAIAAGLNQKTVQRVERTGAASLQTKKALASVFDLPIDDLDLEDTPMKPCPECGSDAVYAYQGTIATNPECLPDILPRLGSGITSKADLLPVVCEGCGFVRYFADGKARARLSASAHWRKV